jgi:hypothetical protein
MDPVHTGNPRDQISAPAAAAQRGQFLTIVEDDATFPFTWEEFAHTSFTLRNVPDDLHKIIRRKYTKTKYERNQPREITDWNEVAEASLAHAVVAITGLRRRVKKSNEHPDGTAAVQWEDLDTTTRDRYLQLLPERCKAEILRICVGKEAGELDPND